MGYLLTTTKYPFNFTQPQPPRISPNSLHNGLQLCNIKAFKYIINLARLWLPSSYNHNLQKNLQPCSITASGWISQFTCCQPPNLGNYCLQGCTSMAIQVHLRSRSITASKFVWSRPHKCISILAQSQPPREGLGSLDHHLQAHWELLPSTVCTQS